MLRIRGLFARRKERRAAFAARGGGVAASRPLPRAPTPFPGGTAAGRSAGAGGLNGARRPRSHLQAAGPQGSDFPKGNRILRAAAAARWGRRCGEGRSPSPLAFGGTAAGRSAEMRTSVTWQKNRPTALLSGDCGVPGGIRTRDLLVRSQTLYPAELRAHAVPFRTCLYIIPRMEEFVKGRAAS